MRSDRERLLYDLLLALEAPLRGKVRRHFHNSCSGTLSLEHEYILESGPTRVGDGLGKVVVLEHISDPQVLDRYEGVGVNVLPSRLVGVVLALAGDLEVLFCCLPGRFVTAIRTLPASRRFALCPPELLLRLLETTRVLDCVPVRVGHEVFEPNVQADTRTVSLLGHVPKIADDEDVPMAVGSVKEMRGFGRSFERPMLFDLKPTPKLLGNPQPSGVGIKEHVPPRAVLSKLDRVPAIRSLEAREANFLSKLLTVKEPLEGLTQPVGKRLYDCLRDILTTAPLERHVQVVVAEKLARVVVMSFDRFEHFVVKMAAFRQRRKEQTILFPVGKKAVLERLHHYHYRTVLGLPLRAAIHRSAKADSPLSAF